MKFLTIFLFLMVSGWTAHANRRPFNIHDVTHAEIIIDRRDLIYPGSIVDLGVVLKTLDGNELYTKGLLDGKVGWKYLRVESDFASELWGKLHIAREAIAREFFYVHVFDRRSDILLASRRIVLNRLNKISIDLPDKFY